VSNGENKSINTNPFEIAFQQSYIIASEFIFNCKDAEITGRLSEFILQISSETDNFSQPTKIVINYSNNILPSELLKFLIESDEIQFAKIFLQSKDELELSLNKLTEQQNEIYNLKRSLDQYKIAFNFVKLTRGFRSLKKRKSHDLGLIHTDLFLFGGAIVLALF
jgi:hypothetical protein